MEALVLAAISALAYGVSDFVGGLKARSAHFAWVTLASMSVLAVGMLAWTIGYRPGTPTAGDLALGAVGGAAEMLGTLMLMRGLAAGAMHVAGPLSAVVSAAIPVLVGVAGGDRPSVLTWIGIAAALPAVWLIASGESAEPDVAAGPGVPSASGRGTGAPEGARDGILAGLGFGVFFAVVGLTEPSAGGWPLVSASFTAVALLAVGVVFIRPPGRPRDGLGGWLAGALSVAALVTFYLATQAGMLSVVAVVTSLSRLSRCCWRWPSCTSGPCPGSCSGWRRPRWRSS